MITDILLKKGSGVPSSLKIAEPAVDLLNKILYIGLPEGENGGSNYLKIIDEEKIKNMFEDLPIKDMSGQTVITSRGAEPVVAAKGAIVLLDTRERVYSNDETLIDTDNIESGNVATGEWSLSMGSKTTATGKNSLAMGKETIASASYSTAMGYKTVASASMATATGRSTIASGANSLAAGQNTIAKGGHSMAVGLSSVASGLATFAGGNHSEASGDYSFSVGTNVKSTAVGSISFGYNSVSSGNYSLVCGTDNKTIGKNSTAFGASNIASAQQSFVVGYDNVASGNHQFVEGKYNVEDTENKYIHIAGNGDSYKARKNAYTLDWNGNACYSGDVYVKGSNTSTGKKVATQESVDNIYNMINNLHYYCNKDIVYNKNLFVIDGNLMLTIDCSNIRDGKLVIPYDTGKHQTISVVNPENINKIIIPRGFKLINNTEMTDEDLVSIFINLQTIVRIHEDGAVLSYNIVEESMN